MKVAKHVIDGVKEYILDLENGEVEHCSFEYVEDKEKGYILKGLKHMQILEEYLDLEGKKKRIVYREDALKKIQVAYVCECAGSMILSNFHNGFDGESAYYDIISTYKCNECNKEYVVKTMHKGVEGEY